jgi:hypothetical protein
VQGKAVTNKKTTKIIIFMQCRLFSANFKAGTINETYLGMFGHDLYNTLSRSLAEIKILYTVETYIKNYYSNSMFLPE